MIHTWDSAASSLPTIHSRIKCRKDRWTRAWRTAIAPWSTHQKSVRKGVVLYTVALLGVLCGSPSAPVREIWEERATRRGAEGDPQSTPRGETFPFVAPCLWG